VAVTGQGSLKEDRSADMEGWCLEQSEAQKKLRAVGATGVPLSDRIFAEGTGRRSSPAIY
jgi:hypothetical protein